MKLFSSLLLLAFIASASGANLRESYNNDAALKVAKSGAAKAVLGMAHSTTMQASNAITDGSAKVGDAVDSVKTSVGKGMANLQHMVGMSTDIHREKCKQGVTVEECCGAKSDEDSCCQRGIGMWLPSIDERAKGMFCAAEQYEKASDRKMREMVSTMSEIKGKLVTLSSLSKKKISEIKRDFKYRNLDTSKEGSKEDRLTMLIADKGDDSRIVNQALKKVATDYLTIVNTMEAETAKYKTAKASVDKLLDEADAKLQDAVATMEPHTQKLEDAVKVLKKCKSSSLMGSLRAGPATLLAAFRKTKYLVLTAMITKKAKEKVAAQKEYDATIARIAAEQPEITTEMEEIEEMCSRARASVTSVTDSITTEGGDASFLELLQNPKKKESYYTKLYNKGKAAATTMAKKAGQMYDDFDTAATNVANNAAASASKMAKEAGASVKQAGASVKKAAKAVGDGAKAVYKKLTHDICEDDEDCATIKAWKTTNQKGPSNSAMVESMKKTLDAAESLLAREYKRVDALNVIVNKDRSAHAGEMEAAMGKNKELSKTLKNAKVELNKLIAKRDSFNRKVAVKSKDLYVFLVKASKTIAKIEDDTEKCVNKANEIPGEIAKLDELFEQAERKHKKCKGKLLDQAEAKKEREDIKFKVDHLEKAYAHLSKSTQDLLDKTDAAEAQNLAANNNAERDAANLVEANAALQDLPDRRL